MPIIFDETKQRHVRVDGGPGSGRRGHTSGSSGGTHHVKETWSAGGHHFTILGKMSKKEAETNHGSHPVGGGT